MNATAALHDNLEAGIWNIGGGFAHTLYYAAFIPTMPLAAAAAYTTLIGPTNAALYDENRN